jgi:nucleoside-diphosphate-sugar epimerase
MDEICVIGGSRYFGRRLIGRLRDGGARVTVINRGSAPAPAGVTQLVADRDDERQLRAVLGERSFDAVIDQVLYRPEQAAIAQRVFEGRTERYVMTSTIEVYAPLRARAPLPESAVDAGSLPLRPADQYEYGEGKRQAEAVLARGGLPYVAVRTGHVLGGGAADFTGRLSHYLDRIRRGEPVAVHPEVFPSSFIEYEEIADFLVWAAGAEFTGPVNARSHGEFDVRELCELIGERVGRRPVYGPVTDEPSPFSFGHYYGMDNSRAEQLGYRFSQTADWLPAVLGHHAPATG